MLDTTIHRAIRNRPKRCAPTKSLIYTEDRALTGIEKGHLIAKHMETYIRYYPSPWCCIPLHGLNSLSLLDLWKQIISWSRRTSFRKKHLHTQDCDANLAKTNLKLQNKNSESVNNLQMIL